MLYTGLVYGLVSLGDLMGILGKTFYHRSPHEFSHPSYEGILNNVKEGRHEKSMLGLWTTTLPSLDTSFGEHLYEITLKCGAKVLEISNSGLYDIYHEAPSVALEEGERTKQLREEWANYDMIYLDEWEQVLLKFDNITFTSKR